MVTSSCTRIMKGDGTHESNWPVLESWWLHPPGLELWSWWNSWKYLANPWELMVTSSCTRIMKDDGTHESTWPILESLWLHPPALELWSWWNSWKYLSNPWELMVTSSCTRIMKGDGTHESTRPILESLWLHPSALKLWSCWNSWKYLANPWELMVTSSCIRIMKLMEWRRPSSRQIHHSTASSWWTKHIMPLLYNN